MKTAVVLWNLYLCCKITTVLILGGRMFSYRVCSFGYVTFNHDSLKMPQWIAANQSVKTEDILWGTKPPDTSVDAIGRSIDRWIDMISYSSDSCSILLSVSAFFILALLTLWSFNPPLSFLLWIWISSHLSFFPVHRIAEHNIHS